ncbi:uncharacterized protein EV154DRAFT_562766 [Mucor mucedo]|uniref:uncharacterized protein n=1 Tax=Mucor mucedo TaxID=29922 RepID=UPI00221F5025|nr:uncharacterized protein EV154DRAFT_562766 [Mucor mucedo]KAI7891924.1 hypothetical protein EV154DRAFT_562766 [Mucor mucedo]
MNNQYNNNNLINHQFVEVTPNGVAYEEQEVPVIVPAAPATADATDAAATIKQRNDRLNTTRTAPIENWAYHDALENATSEMPTVTPTTMYTSLAGETIDDRGEVVVLDDEEPSKTMVPRRGLLVGLPVEVEARRFEHGQPERRMFSGYLALSTTFFGQMLKSMEKRDQVQSRIAE